MYLMYSSVHKGCSLFYFLYQFPWNRIQTMARALFKVGVAPIASVPYSNTKADWSNSLYYRTKSLAVCYVFHRELVGGYQIIQTIYYFLFHKFIPEPFLLAISFCDCLSDFVSSKKKTSGQRTYMCSSVAELSYK